MPSWNLYGDHEEAAEPAPAEGVKGKRLRGMAGALPLSGMARESDVQVNLPTRSAGEPKVSCVETVACCVVFRNGRVSIVVVRLRRAAWEQELRERRAPRVP